MSWKNRNTAFGIAAGLALAVFVINADPPLSRGQAASPAASTAVDAPPTALKASVPSAFVTLESGVWTPTDQAQHLNEVGRLLPAVAGAPTPLLTFDQRARMSRSVQRIAEVGGEQFVEVIISYEDSKDLLDTAGALELGGEVDRTFENLGMQTMRIPASMLAQLSIGDGIEMIGLNEPVHAAVAAARVAANGPTFGIPG